MVHVTVTTAVELTSDQAEEIKKAVSKKYGKEVTYSTVVDPSILGGVQITIGSKLLDGSVKNKIRQLKTSMTQAAQ